MDREEVGLDTSVEELAVGRTLEAVVDDCMDQWELSDNTHPEQTPLDTLLVYIRLGRVSVDYNTAIHDVPVAHY
jgi:hypothetical protein